MRFIYFNVLTILLLITSVVPALAQEVSFTLRDDVPVTKDGLELDLAWTGGVDAPQVNMMDINGDGAEDVILFERTTFTIMVFETVPGGLEYSPGLTDKFPEGIEHWFLLRDFNGDGKKDIFTSSPLGMIVYVNESEGDEVRWRLYDSRAPGPSPLMTVGFNGNINLQVNATDIPGIDDIDGDGDLDILVFRFTGNSSVEWHRNMAIEETGTLDTMMFVRETQRWGDFEECTCGIFAYSGETCPPSSGKVAHAGGKSMLTLDWSGDGDMDLIMSEETCQDLYLLENDGTSLTQVLQSFDESIPFPAAYYEDTDGDGIRDLVVASNVQSSTQIVSDFSKTLRVYKNTGSNVAPAFDPQANPFLQDRMIDVGSGAAPAFFDSDGDGDQDMFIGTRYSGFIPEPTGSIVYFENTGSRSAPEFTWRDRDYLALSKYKLHNIQPQFRDINRDGLTDLVFLADDESGDRRLYAIENENGGLAGEPYVLFSEFFPFDTFSLNYVNDDNVIDMIITRAAGRAELYLGEMAAGESLQLQLQTVNFLGIQNDPLKSRGRLLMADLNGNRIPDAIYTYGNGRIFWSPDPDPEVNAVFEELNISGAGTNVQFGSYLWLEEGRIFGGSGIVLAVGNSRGGVQLLQGEAQLPGEGLFLVYPNPVVKSDQPVLFVESDENLQLSIVDLSGRILSTYESISAGIHSISLEGISAGLYLLVGRQDGKIKVSRRIVVVE